MIFELPEERYRNIRHLFKDKSFLNVFRSHLERTSIKKSVYVDNLENPQTAVIVVIPRLFFGGKANNDTFNTEFRKLLFGELKEEFLKRNQHEVDCYFSNEEWRDGIPDVLIEPFFYERYYYEIKELRQKKWRDLIPESYTVQPVDLSLLEKNYLENYDWLIEEIEENWLPFEENLQEIRGYYVLRENKEIISWCTLEYLTDENEIEVGIATRKEYQKHGFGTIVGSATSEYALKHYKTIGWNCSVGNIGSNKTAQKIGFELHTPYTKAGCFFNKIDNLLIHGYTQAEMNNYDKAIKYYEDVIRAYTTNDPAISDAVVIGEEFPLNYVMFRTGTYYAALNKPQEAFGKLHQAIKHGFNNKKMLEEDELLSKIRKEKEWKNILKHFD